MDSMVKTVHKHVTTNVMVVTTLTVFVIEDVIQAGWDTIVKNIMYFDNTMFSFFGSNEMVINHYLLNAFVCLILSLHLKTMHYTCY